MYTASRNKLLLIIDIQAIYKREKKEYLTTRYVYKTFIYPTYRINERTLYKYLSCPASLLLRQLDAKQNTTAEAGFVSAAEAPQPQPAALV